MARMKKVVSALLGLMALSVVVRCGDRDEDEEDERRRELSASPQVQATPYVQASLNDLEVKASALLIKAGGPAALTHEPFFDQMARD